MENEIPTSEWKGFLAVHHGQNCTMKGNYANLWWKSWHGGTLLLGIVGSLKQSGASLHWELKASHWEAWTSRLWLERSLNLLPLHVFFPCLFTGVWHGKKLPVNEGLQTGICRCRWTWRARKGYWSHKWPLILSIYVKHSDSICFVFFVCIGCNLGKKIRKHPFGSGKHTTDKHGDDWGMFHELLPFPLLFINLRYPLVN